MKELVVLSGKGGTGKTSLVGCIAFMSQPSVLVDCDVDAANLHLILQSEVGKSCQFVSGKKARIDPALCTDCGICADSCRFGAVGVEDTDRAGTSGRFVIDEIACEGCGVCRHVCPEDAVTLHDNISGQWFESTSGFGPFVHGELGVGQGNSGKLVSLLRQRAREVSREHDLPLIVIDGPPGIGCPTIASVSGADYALVVTEPSPTARHDMERLLQLTRHFRVRTGVCINKCDLNEKVAAGIEDDVVRAGADFLGRIHFDRSFTDAQRKATTLLALPESRTTEDVRAVWVRLLSAMAAPESSGDSLQTGNDALAACQRIDPQQREL